MPAVSNIVLNDGSATPVAYTFTPIGKDKKSDVYWFEQSTPAPTNKLGAVRLGIKTVRATDFGKTLDEQSHISYSIHVPTLETLGTGASGTTPAPTVAYKEVARCMFDLAERSLTQERKNTRVFCQNLLAHAVAQANIDDLSPMWG